MADPVSMTAFISAMAPSTAAAGTAAATAAAMAAPTAAALTALGSTGGPLTAAMSSGMQAGNLLGMAGNTAANAVPTIIQTPDIFSKAATMYGNSAPAVDAGIFAPQYAGLNSSAMTNLPGQTLGRSSLSVGPQAPTFAQSAINTGQNIYGLMGENPALTSVAKQAGGAMMQPPPPPQVLQAPPIQSGQFAPVDFMSLLSQKPQQMQRRTSLLG